MTSLILASALGIAGVTAVAVLGMLEAEYTKPLGWQFWRVRAILIWAAVCGSANGVAIVYLNFLIKDKDVIGETSVPDFVEYLLISAGIFVFFSVLVFAHLPPQDLLNSGFRERYRKGGRTVAAVVGMLIFVVVQVNTGSGRSPTGSIAAALEFGLLQLLAAGVLFAIFWLYARTWRTSFTHVWNRYQQLAQDLAKRLEPFEDRLLGEIDRRIKILAANRDPIASKYERIRAEAVADRLSAFLVAGLHIWIFHFGPSHALARRRERAMTGKSCPLTGAYQSECCKHEASIAKRTVFPVCGACQHHPTFWVLVAVPT